jgi:hypothetical protein
MTEMPKFAIHVDELEVYAQKQRVSYNTKPTILSSYINIFIHQYNMVEKRVITTKQPKHKTYL